MRALKWLWIIVPMVLLFLVVGWRYGERAKKEKQQEQESKGRQGAAPSVEVEAAGPRTIVKALEVVGTAESPFRVEISPKTSGRIEFLTAREGDVVKKGDVLVRIDPSEVSAQVAQQQAALAETRSRLTQAQISEGPSIAGVKSQIAQQQAMLTSAQANYNQIEKNYKATIASADASVNDASAKLASANVLVANAQSSVSLQKANLANAQAKYDRTNSLYKQGFIAAQDLDDAKAALDVQKSTLEVTQGQVTAAQSAVTSAMAVVESAKNQASIAREKGQADIAAAKAQVEQQRAALNLAKANSAQNPAYQQNLKALGSTVQASQAQLEQAQSRLADTVLRSPIDGIVTARSADPGALASPGTAVLVVQSFDWLYVEGSVPVSDSGVVKVGEVADVAFDALPKQTFSGAITHVNPAADLASRKISFQVRLDNKAGSLKPGMFGNVAIPTERIKAPVAVPREAVKDGPGGKQTVTVVNGKGEAEIRDVKVGATDTKFSQILEGVKPGEKVVTLTFRPLRDGQKVNVGGDDNKKKGDSKKGEKP